MATAILCSLSKSSLLLWEWGIDQQTFRSHLPGRILLRQSCPTKYKWVIVFYSRSTIYSGELTFLLLSTLARNSNNLVWLIAVSETTVTIFLDQIVLLVYTWDPKTAPTMMILRNYCQQQTRFMRGWGQNFCYFLLYHFYQKKKQERNGEDAVGTVMKLDTGLMEHFFLLWKEHFFSFPLIFSFSLSCVDQWNEEWTIISAKE